MTERIVLAYAGSAADTAAVRRLAAAQRGELVAVVLDVGQLRDVGEIRDRALSEGVARAHVLDVREDFARDHALPALKGESLPDVTSLAAPLVAARVVDIARIENAAVEQTAAAAGPNLLARPVVDIAHAPETPAQLDVLVEEGTPVSINGVPMALTELFESVALIAGRHAVGRVAGVDAPAAVILHAAFRALGGRDGLVRFSLLKGQHTIVAVEQHAPRQVTHA